MALAIGLSLGTAASLSRLLAFQPAFQAAGILIAGGAAWWNAARRAAAFTVDPARRVGAPLYVLGAFAAGFVLVNQALIPLLERLPWLLAGK